MGQREILNLLAQNKNNYFTSKEMSSKIGISTVAVSTSIVTLKNMNIINSISDGKTFRYGFKQ